MVKEAVESLDGQASYSDIRNYIRNKYGQVNEKTIVAQTIICTVNHNSRIHYTENQKPRICESRYDFLYTTGRGQVELYNPDKHGVWEIAEDDFGNLIVQQYSEDIPDEDLPIESKGFEFSFEKHLRDFIIRNMESIRFNDQKIMLFVDDYGRDGKEYPTEVGPIDILAVDNVGNFYVFELKLTKGFDKAVGQILRYMGWIKGNLASNKDVKGIIVSKKAHDKLKYAASMVPEISLFEYELEFNIMEVKLN